MQAPSDAGFADVVTRYRNACERSDDIIRQTDDLSTLSAIANPDEEQLDSLRAVVAHMIEETARHAGHADIIREQLDGTTAD